jgi:glycosyltransferase involved in cell wall biosynthesis
MRLLIFTSNVEPKDGWSVVGYNIVRHFQCTSTLCYSGEEKYKFAFGRNRCKSELFETYGYLVLLWDLLNVLIYTKGRPDAIYCNVEHYAPVAMWLSRIYDVPYLITAHGTYGVTLPVRYKIYRKAFENANCVVCVSRYTRKRMEEEGIRGIYRVIRNGVDKTKFVPRPGVSKENIVLFVGNLKPRKGFSFLLETMPRVAKTIPGVGLVVAGRIDCGSARYRRVSEYIERHGLRVRFLGEVTEEALIEHYQRAKINVLPSQTTPMCFEGFGLVHVEANACGTLTIGTRNCGNEDAILEDNGLVVDYGDVNALSQGIIDALTIDPYPEIDHELIDDWSVVAERYMLLLDNITRERGAIRQTSA